MMGTLDGARPRRRRGAAIAALIVLFVLAPVLLLGQAISAFGLLLVAVVVLGIVSLVVLPGANAHPEGGGRPLSHRVALGILGLVAAGRS